ncbi:hypothetical protein ACFLRX_09750, partial [Acidobacteriota bacterium]
NLHELPDLFQSYIADSTVLNRENCPSPKILSECLLGKTSKKNKNRVIEHITHCKFCLEEFQFILNIQREEKTLMRKISHLLIGHSKKRRTDKGGIHFPFRQKTWNWAYISAGLFMILAVALTLYVIINGESEQKFRGPEINHIKLIQPLHKEPTKTPIVFLWKRMENAEYYILELFDNSLSPIWKSKQIPGNKVQLPKDIMESLSSGKSYYWFVTGFLSKGRRIESSMEQFQIKK